MILLLNKKDKSMSNMEKMQKKPTVNAEGGNINGTRGFLGFYSFHPLERLGRSTLAVTTEISCSRLMMTAVELACYYHPANSPVCRYMTAGTQTKHIEKGVNGKKLAKSRKAKRA